MLLIAHIFIAVSSLIVTALTYFKPSSSKLNASYVLVGLTLASGTYLVASRPAHIMQTCITGLVYLGVIFAGIIAARHKLSRAQA